MKKNTELAEEYISSYNHTSKNLKETAKNLFKEIQIIFNSVPSYVVALFVVSVILMNLLANKSVEGLPDWMAFDCGFSLSWLSFLCMDMLVKHFGPRVSIFISIFALLCNLIMAVVFYLVSLVPGVWSAYFDYGEQQVINQALDKTIGGTWFVLLGSSIAFLASSIVNAITNHTIGKRLKKDNFISYNLRSYISTAVAQFIDNFIFAYIVSMTFFGWSFIQAITCATIAMLFETLCEFLVGPIGYKITKSWAKNNVGKEYFSIYPTINE